jgi:diacylglycerol O-acyltransferase / wax synthase
MAEQLRSIDSAFLDLESPTGHLQGVGVITLDAGAENLTVGELKELVRQRLPELDVFRRQLVTVPAGMDRSYWTETSPDLDVHIREVDLGPGRGDERLEEFCSELAGTKLDRSRPLWELWLVHGLRDDRQALVVKIHHSLCDGLGSLALVAQLLDTERRPDTLDGSDAPDAPDATPDEESPTAFSLLARGTLHALRWPITAVGTTIGLAASIGRLGRVVGAAGGSDLAAPLATPDLPFNGPITGRRSAALRDLPLDRVKGVAHAAGVHVNDVVLAVVAGTLRRWLVAHDALPDKALVAAVPISTRGPDELFAPGNHVSAYFAHLPVHLGSARERLEVTAASSDGGKAAHEAVGSSTLEHLTALLVPMLTAPPLAAYGRLRLASVHPAPVNLVVSDVAGPTMSLYLAGRRAAAFYALGPVFDGVALNITAVSYKGVIGVGYLTCPDRLPDLGGLAEEQAAAFDELACAYGV